MGFLVFNDIVTMFPFSSPLSFSTISKAKKNTGIFKSRFELVMATVKCQLGEI